MPSPNLPPLPCVLLIGGLDPSAGAGLAADQRACLATGAWPLPVASIITVQSTTGLQRVYPLPPDLVHDQASLLLRDQKVKAVKIGALGSAAVIETVHRLVDALPPHVPVVIDPVLGATRGANGLLHADALDALKRLAQRCTVLTPNRHEASVLSGIDIRDSRSAERAAIHLRTLGTNAVLVKGGHLHGATSIDWLATPNGTVKLTAKRLDIPEFHGSGCTMASLIAAHLAVHHHPQRPHDVVSAARYAKRTMSRALKNHRSIGKGLAILPLQRF